MALNYNIKLNMFDCDWSTLLDKFLIRLGILVTMCIVFWIGTHFYSKLTRAKPMRLNQDSYVVVIGGAQGMGLEMCRILSERFGCHIFMVDIRKDLFEKIEKELKNMNCRSI